VAWLTDVAIKDALAGFMGTKDAAQLDAQGSYWAGVITRANGRAKEDILGILLSRGYDAPSILSWDNLADAHRDQALFWCSVYSGGKGLQPDVIETLQLLDRRQSLQSDPIIAGGVAVDPPDTSGNRINHGKSKFKSKLYPNLEL
jgi:hypothetical protein